MYICVCIYIYIIIIMCTHCDDDTRMSQHSGGKRSMPCQGSTAGISARALALDVWSLVHQGMITGRLELATLNVSRLGHFASASHQRGRPGHLRVQGHLVQLGIITEVTLGAATLCAATEPIKQLTAFLPIRRMENPWKSCEVDLLQGTIYEFLRTLGSHSPACWRLQS